MIRAPRFKRTGFLARIVLVGIGPAVLLGCSGHGKHTSDHLARAQTRMNELRSATEWDMARQAFLAGDLDRAEQRVTKSLAMNEGVAKSHVLLGRIRLEQGLLDDALRALQTAELIDPSFIDTHYYQAVVHERAGDKELALAEYRYASDLDPKEPQYALAAAEMMIDLGRLEAADAFLHDRESNFEHDAGIRQAQGHLALMRGDSQRAVEIFQEARLLAPEDPGVLEDLARALVGVDRHAEAAHHLGDLSKLPEHEERRDLKLLRAQSLIEIDRSIEARELLIEITHNKDEASDPETWLTLGRLAYDMGDMTRLRQAGQRLMALAPHRADGYVFRAVWLMRHGAPDEALEVLEEGSQRAKNPADALVLRAVIQRELGHTDSAQSSIRAALTHAPEHEDALRMLNFLNAEAVASFPVE